MGTESLDTQAQHAHIRLLAPKLSRKPIADSGPPHAILQLHGKSLIKEDLLSKPHRKKALCAHSLSGSKCMAVGECHHHLGAGDLGLSFISVQAPQWVAGAPNSMHHTYLCMGNVAALLGPFSWARFTVSTEPGKRKWDPLGFAGKGRRHNRIGRMGCAKDISACIASVHQPGLWSAISQSSAC